MDARSRQAPPTRSCQWHRQLGQILRWPGCGTTGAQRVQLEGEAAPRSGRREDMVQFSIPPSDFSSGGPNVTGEAGRRSDTPAYTAIRATGGIFEQLSGARQNDNYRSDTPACTSIMDDRQALPRADSTIKRSRHADIQQALPHACRFQAGPVA